MQIIRPRFETVYIYLVIPQVAEERDRGPLDNTRKSHRREGHHVVAFEQRQASNNDERADGHLRTSCGHRAKAGRKNRGGGGVEDSLVVRRVSNIPGIPLLML